MLKKLHLAGVLLLFLLWGSTPSPAQHTFARGTIGPERELLGPVARVHPSIHRAPVHHRRHRRRRSVRRHHRRHGRNPYAGATLEPSESTIDLTKGGPTETVKFTIKSRHGKALPGRVTALVHELDTLMFTWTDSLHRTLQIAGLAPGEETIHACVARTNVCADLAGIVTASTNGTVTGYAAASPAKTDSPGIVWGAIQGIGGIGTALYYWVLGSYWHMILTALGIISVVVLIVLLS